VRTLATLLACAALWRNAGTALNGDSLKGSAAAESSPTPPLCVGDCDRNGWVTVDEIVIAVNIALDRLPLDACPAADLDGDFTVTVDELVAAVNAALMGCPTSPPIATATGSPTGTAPPTPTPLGGCVEPFTPTFGCFIFGGSFNACLDAGSGTQCFAVTAPTDCCWNATVHDGVVCASDDAVLTEGQQGCGNGRVCFHYGRNPCRRDLRNIDVVVGDKTFYALQFFAFTPTATRPPYLGTPTPVPTPFGGCVEPFPLVEGSSFVNARLGPEAGTECFDVFAASECCWRATLLPDPICSLDDVLLATGAHGCGDGNFCFSYGPNQCVQGASEIAREITLKFGDKPFIAFQGPGPTPTP